MRVVLCVDPLINGADRENYDLLWLTRMLRRPITQALGREPEVLRSSDWDREAFFLRSGLPFDPRATLLPFEEQDFRPASLELLRKSLNGDTLLIGFELAEPTRAILDRIGVTWINLWQHPIRFLDDVLFAFASNDPAIHEALRAFDLPEETYWLYANRTATMLQLLGEGPALPDGCGVFIGQTLADKAILHRGQFLNLLDYQEEFTSFAHRCNHVYYSRHPWVDRGDEEILRFLSRFGNVDVGNCPAYALFASDSVHEVMSISSSSAIEARFFGKQVTVLFRPVIRLGSGPDPEEYRSVYQDLVSPHFWSAILSPRLPTRPAPPVSFLAGKDKLRDMLRWHYNYRVIDKTESLKGEVENLRTEVGSIRVEVPDIRAAAEGLRADHDRLRGETDRLREEKDRLVEEAERLRRELEELRYFKFIHAFQFVANQIVNDGHAAVLICGTGRLAPLAAKAAKAAGLRIRAFTDRNPRLQGTTLHGARVLSLGEGLRLGLPCLVGSSDFALRIKREIERTAKKLGLPVPAIYLPKTLV